MQLSRQFRALGRIAALFAVVWGVSGALLGITVGPSAIGETPIAAAVTFATAYAIGGGIAGIVTALLLSRLEADQDVAHIKPQRLVTWGVIGGVIPAALLATLGLIAGAPIARVWPLMSIGVVGGLIGGLVLGSASAFTKRRNDTRDLTQVGLRAWAHTPIS
jgi:hypothetical protein